MEMNLSGLMADNGYDYPTDKELKNIFAASCVEAVARHEHVSTSEMYKRMKRVGLFEELIYPCYETLHSQSRDIVTEDILEALRIREKKLEGSRA